MAAALGSDTLSEAGFAGTAAAVEGVGGAERESLGELSTPGNCLASFPFGGGTDFLLA